MGFFSRFFKKKQSNADTPSEKIDGNVDITLMPMNKIKELAEKNPTHALYQGVKNPQDYNMRFLAMQQSMIGNYDSAIEYASKGLKINPESHYLYYIRGRSYGDKGEFDLGIKDLSKAVELRVDFADAYVERGVIKKRQGKKTEADADFTKAQELEPSIQLPK